MPLVSRVRLLQGRLLGKLQTLGFDLNVEAQVDAMTLEVVKTSEIEGVSLNNEQVRSSVARHLGVDNGVLPLPKECWLKAMTAPSAFTVCQRKF